MIKLNIGESVLELIVGDISKQDTDAIVNAANMRLIPGGGVDGAIHRGAGPELYQECKKIGGCHVGDAKLTKGYRLPAKFVIQTVGPRYSGSDKAEEKLASCYIQSLKIARKQGIKSLSFPAISTGVYRYPMKEAARIALSTVIHELEMNPSVDLVRFVLYDNEAFEIYENVLRSIINNDFHIVDK
jgi:O-acetyl-ADP-ribose deacetylase (regulator of RNase III)